MVRYSMPRRWNCDHPPKTDPPTSPLPNTRVWWAYRPVRMVARDGQHNAVGTMPREYVVPLRTSSSCVWLMPASDSTRWSSETIKTMFGRSPCRIATGLAGTMPVGSSSPDSSATATALHSSARRRLMAMRGLFSVVAPSGRLEADALPRERSLSPTNGNRSQVGREQASQELPLVADVPCHWAWGPLRAALLCR